jgi:hypothetical protein
MHENGVNAAVFLIVAIVGLVLTPQPIGVRLWWLAGLVIVLVLAAVFAPSLAAALLGPALQWALALVLLVWLVRMLAWAIPKVFAWLATRPARAAATAAVVAAAATTGTPPPTPPGDVGSPFAASDEGSPPSASPSEGQEGGASHG